MKKLIFLCFAICLIQINLKSQTKQDSSAIRETALNYIEGWYSGDSSRMGKALHPELAKKGILPSKDGKGVITRATYTDMVTWTSKRPNLLKDNKDILRDVIIIEIGKNIANVKCISKDFIDYLHLGRINNEWRIFNAIWEPNNKK